MIQWAYGVTTVPERRYDTLPRTLASLAAAGFDRPRLFVDGACGGWDDLRLPCTYRSPALKCFGNWALSLWELFIRDPRADRYALFQDDLVCVRGLRAYLERCRFPDGESGSPEPRGYWNLYTSPSNQSIALKDGGSWRTGWYLSNQYGRGALALVFSRKAVVALLSSEPHFVERPLSATHPTDSVDGAIVCALAKKGWKEWVHSPSLVQHTGDRSTINKNLRRVAPLFPGEDADALALAAGYPVVPLSIGARQ